MGVVSRAFDPKLRRLVAIKLLPDLADAGARHRFQREARSVTALNHPHILTVYDVGEHDGRQYLVTELVEGGALRSWAAAEKRSPRQIVDMLVGVADGLATAHGAGIIHRDIKPENILIAKNGYAKLADFGLAKLFQPDTEQASTRRLTIAPTRPGMIAGTVGYMSPEQASGHPVDARSDIFSFGAVLYELFAGTRPVPPTPARIGAPARRSKRHLFLRGCPVRAVCRATAVLRQLRSRRTAAHCSPHARAAGGR